jgi:hypothetical protein
MRDAWVTLLAEVKRRAAGGKEPTHLRFLRLDVHTDRRQGDPGSSEASARRCRKLCMPCRYCAVSLTSAVTIVGDLGRISCFDRARRRWGTAERLRARIRAENGCNGSHYQADNAHLRRVMMKAAWSDTDTPSEPLRVPSNFFDFSAEPILASLEAK